MAKVLIGDVTYDIPELNFIALELAWPFIEEAMSSTDVMKGPAAGIGIVAAGIMEAESFDRSQFGILQTEVLSDKDCLFRVMYFLKKKMKATQIMGVRECINEIIKEAGLEPKEGEDQPVMGTSNPSPETAPASSLNSSQPDAKGEAGTE